MDLSPEELHEWLSRQAPRGFRLVDVREEDEFAICRIDTAELIPLSRFMEEAPRRLADKSQPVVVYCHHGMRSAHAADAMRRLGWEQVFNLAGGIDAWSQRVDPAVARY